MATQEQEARICLFHKKPLNDEERLHGGRSFKIIHNGLKYNVRIIVGAKGYHTAIGKDDCAGRKLLKNSDNFPQTGTVQLSHPCRNCGGQLYAISTVVIQQK